MASVLSDPEYDGSYLANLDGRRGNSGLSSKCGLGLAVREFAAHVQKRRNRYAGTRGGDRVLFLVSAT